MKKEIFGVLKIALVVALLFTTVIVVDAMTESGNRGVLPMVSADGDDDGDGTDGGGGGTEVPDPCAHPPGWPDPCE
ncbi:MAG: hypothetical protein ABIE94_01790 [archaeon]